MRCRIAIRTWHDAVKGTRYYDPLLDISLQNVLAAGVWYEREEFEKEEGSTPKYQALQQVNALIRQTIDLANSPQAPTRFGE